MVEGAGDAHGSRKMADGADCERHETELDRLCLLYLCAMEMLAQDAVQETFVKAYKRAVDSPAAVAGRAWLTRIAINVCKDIRRGAWFRRADTGSVTPETLPDKAAPGAAENDALADAVQRLPRTTARSRAAVLLGVKCPWRHRLQRCASRCPQYTPGSTVRAKRCAGNWKGDVSMRNERIYRALNARVKDALPPRSIRENIWAALAKKPAGLHGYPRVILLDSARSGADRRCVRRDGDALSTGIGAGKTTPTGSARRLRRSMGEAAVCKADLRQRPPMQNAAFGESTPDA